MLNAILALTSVQAVKVAHRMTKQQPPKLPVELLEMKAKNTPTDEVLDYQGFLPYDDFNAAWAELNADGDWLNNAISQDHGMVFQSHDDVPHDDAWCDQEADFLAGLFTLSDLDGSGEVTPEELDRSIELL